MPAAPRIQDSDDPCTMPVERLTRLYAAGGLTPVEVTQAVLDRIERADGAVNAFALRLPEEALDQARAAEDRWRKGQPLGPIDGVPATIKDLNLMRGHPTLMGSRIVDRTGPWTEDAPAVAALRAGGAIFVGKTTTCEFGWKGVTDSPLGSITRIPWDPGRQHSLSPRRRRARPPRGPRL